MYRLFLHLHEPLIITGRVAAAWYARSTGVELPRKPLNDLDFLVSGINAVKLIVTRDFLVAHYHPSRSRGKLLLQLADKEQRTRVDLFTPKTSAVLQRAVDIPVSNSSLRIISPEDLLCHSLTLVLSALMGRKVDPKCYTSILLLRDVCSFQDVEDTWPDYDENSEMSAFDAIRVVETAVANEEVFFCSASYSQDIEEIYPHCTETEYFPLASKSLLLNMWGYV